MTAAPRPALAALVMLASLTAAGIAQPEFDAWEADMLAGRLAEAARRAEDLAERDTQDAVWAYRAGASYARLGDAAAALRWLNACGERGYSGVRTFETDADLDPVRDQAEFAAAVERVRQNAAQRLERFKRAAREAEPITVFPPGHDPAKPAPLLIALHGTGGNGQETADVWRDAAARAGVVLVAPDGLRPAGDGGFSWTFRDEAEWYVLDLVTRTREKAAIDRVILAGYSQGANIALAMGRTHPADIDAVLAVSGHWEDDAAPMPDAPPQGLDDRPRWFLLIGSRDDWARTYEQAERALRNAGMPVERRVMRGIGHGLPGASVRTKYLAEAVRWCLDEPAD